jgi:hypothetical protein
LNSQAARWNDPELTAERLSVINVSFVSPSFRRRAIAAKRSQCAIGTGSELATTIMAEIVVERLLEHLARTRFDPKSLIRCPDCCPRLRARLRPFA